MMLPTDMALIEDAAFLQWVRRYAKDKDLFFADFTKVFDKLMELGIKRDAAGVIVNTDNVKGGYISAPKKSSVAGDAGRTRENDTSHDESCVLKEENQEFRARL